MTIISQPLTHVSVAHRRGKAGRRRLAACLVSTVAFGMLGAAVASAEGFREAFRVKGVQPFAAVNEAVCPGQAANGIAQLMTGGLVGCWYTDTFVPGPLHQNGNDTYTQSFTGTERFTGCIEARPHGMCRPHDPSGTWHTTYVFTATFTEAGAEITGQCWHPIVSGTGDFSHAKGLVHFVDNVPDAISNYVARVELLGA